MIWLFTRVGAPNAGRRAQKDPSRGAAGQRRADSRPRGTRTERGSTLIEALIATAIVLSTITGVAQLLLWARKVIWSSGAATITTGLATEKLEQLRALAFRFDEEGRAITDDSTDLTGAQPSSGGTGLQTSPLGTLYESTSGFVDYLDAQGDWCGTGAAPPAGTVFVRRWAVVPFASDPLNTIALHVVVLPLADGAELRSPRAAHLTTIRTRSAQ
jgi:hypothetical protein